MYNRDKKEHWEGTSATLAFRLQSGEHTNNSFSAFVRLSLPFNFFDSKYLFVNICPKCSKEHFDHCFNRDAKGGYYG